MNWNIAQAKQRFSEVVKQAVAAVVCAEDCAAFEAWRKAQKQPASLADEFAQLRLFMQAEGALPTASNCPPPHRPILLN